MARVETPRERTERIERDTLSPFAVRSAESKGRERTEALDPLRTCFQRDRDRIVHAKAFRRLKHKTQVFLAPEGDHYRVRLTHTLDVSQIARTAARAIGLNEDLTEAIALGHDLGHTPFGHLGEQALTPMLDRPFRHSEQSLRVVDHLENDGEGLNLSWEVRDGILHHPWSMPPPSTLEAQVVRFADRIAYVNHDVDDADARRCPRPERAPRRHRSRSSATPTPSASTPSSPTSSRRVTTRPEIRLSPSVFRALDGLRDFLFAEVYLRTAASDEHDRAIKLLRELFAYYHDHPDELPPEYHRVPGRPRHPRGRLHRRHDRPIRSADLRAALPSPGLAPVAGGHVARIRQEDVEAVKERTDIVQLVGQYLTLKKSGHDSLTGLCPFHQEKTGSFSVSPAKQVFYCFGCGKGGDAITFLRELEHLSYVEAIERLASTGRGHAPLRGRLGRRAPRGRAAQSRCTARTSRRPRCSRRCSPRARRPPTRAPT